MNKIHLILIILSIEITFSNGQNSTVTSTLATTKNIPFYKGT